MRKLVRIIAALGVMVAAAMLCVPYVEDQLYQAEAESSIQTMSDKADLLSDAEAREYLLQAESYNAMVGGYSFEGALGAEDVWEYKDQLLYRDEPMMAYVEIPKIGVKLPIYHCTSAETLMAGVGHLEGTSLPVGGASSHCVLSGHSGMRTSRMFDDLVSVEVGDVFVVWSLGEPYAYRVFSTEVVEPSDTSSLAIEDGRDLATLITCTDLNPGWQRLNTHRLLVHGERCEYVAQDEALAPAAAPESSMRLVVAAAAAFLAFVVVAATAVGLVRELRGR